MSGQMYKVYLMPVLLGIVLLSACGDGANRSEVYEPVSYAVGDTVDVEGSLIDSQCFTMNKANSGMDHPHPVPTSQTGPACARYCAINGIPVAIALDSPTQMSGCCSPILRSWQTIWASMSRLEQSSGPEEFLFPREWRPVFQTAVGRL